MTSAPLAVYVDQVSKAFKSEKNSVQALDNISLSVNRGELFGIIGPEVH